MAAGGEPLSIVDIIKEETEDQVTVTAICENLKTEERRFGIASQPKQMFLKKAQKHEVDKFAWQKALNKAQRNAIRHFLPEVVIKEAYAEWAKKKGAS